MLPASHTPLLDYFRRGEVTREVRLIAAQGALAANIHTVLVDRIPDQTWGNSRWGARLTGVLFRDYTVQGWFFRTFNQAPSKRRFVNPMTMPVDHRQRRCVDALQ